MEIFEKTVQRKQAYHVVQKKAGLTQKLSLSSYFSVSSVLSVVCFFIIVQFFEISIGQSLPSGILPTNPHFRFLLS